MRTILFHWGQWLLFNSMRTILFHGGQWLLLNSMRTILFHWGQWLLLNSMKTILFHGGQWLLFNSMRTILFHWGQWLLLNSMRTILFHWGQWLLFISMRTILFHWGQWLLLNSMRTIFKLYHGKNKWHWDDDDVGFVLDQHAQLDIYSTRALKKTNSPLIDMSHLTDTLSWLQGKHTILLILNALCLVEKQQILCHKMKKNIYIHSPHDKHQSSIPRPVK